MSSFVTFDFGLGGIIFVALACMNINKNKLSQNFEFKIYRNEDL